jgi:hypothetical protein
MGARLKTILDFRGIGGGEFLEVQDISLWRRGGILGFEKRKTEALG